MALNKRRRGSFAEVFIKRLCYVVQRSRSFEPDCHRPESRQSVDRMNGDVRSIFSLYRSCLRQIGRLPTEYLRCVPA